MRKFLMSLLTLAVSLTVLAADRTPRYIFYFIGDGMGYGHIMTTAKWLSTFATDSCTVLNMTSLPVSGTITTYSASSPVTDSAAAGTALATGSKTRNGMLGVTPDSVALESLAEQLQELGYGVGLVTSVAADDATPGAFYAHVPSRSMYYEIGCQAAKSGYQFIAGSQLRGLKGTDLEDVFKRNNYAIVRGLQGLKDVNKPKIVLLDPQNSSNIGFAIENDGTRMTLEAMTRACIEHLDSVAPEQFFMMVEGGAIDWAAHSNDAATVALETLSFDRALGQALDFYREHPDETLIVVTADHETGGLSLGNNATQYDAHLDVLAGQRISKNSMADKVKAMFNSRRNYDWDDIRLMLTEDLGLWSVCPVTDEEEQALKTAWEDIFVKRVRRERETLYGRHDDLTYTAFTVLANHAGNGWTSNAHTGNPVALFAIGVGSELFTGWKDNTDVPLTIMKAVETYRPAPVMMR